MKQFLLLLLFFSLQTFASNSDTTAVFSKALKANFGKYVNLSNKAYNDKDFVKAEQLFDSLVHNSLKGTHFDDFSFQKMENFSRIKLSSINKPVLLLTYSSWCILGKGEIPALNKIAKEYKDKLQIVVVFWDQKKDMKKLAKDFESDIVVCYAHETNHKDRNAIRLLKNTLGFPTSYLIDENMELINISKNAAKFETKCELSVSLDFYYKKFNSALTSLIVIDGFNSTRIAGN